VRVAVDAAGEGGEAAGGEGGGGVPEKIDDRVEVVVEGGELQWSAAPASRCAERQRVLADQELENCGLVAAGSSEMKGRHCIAVGHGQQAPLPRVELGRTSCDHQLNEVQRRREATGPYDERPSMALVEELIDGSFV